jgi:hypothetical protein
MDEPQVFLSYNTGDREAAIAVRNLLHKRGITTFLNGDNLVAGLPWPQALEQGLQRLPLVEFALTELLSVWKGLPWWPSRRRNMRGYGYSRCLK